MDLLQELAAALGERYQVEREIGQGGMAVVFLGEDLKHHRRVAIKVVRPELAVSLGSERFLREIAITAALQHPHILPLFDSGEAGDLLYYVMPFIDGESLRDRLAREQQLPLDVALRITREVGSALQYAHARDVVHRDIKPENIMLAGSHAVVADFGIARALDAAGAGRLTQSGMVVGTPLYMSPESSGGAVNVTGDQYSLACTLYEMLVGAPPFVGPTAAAIMARHSLDPVPSLRTVRQTVPPNVEGAIIRAMAKVPADRFGSIDDFLRALDDAAPAPVASATRPLAATGSARNRARVWIAAAVVLLVTLGVVAARRLGGHGAIAATSIVVLPFEESGANADSAFLGEGMTEGLIADLSQVSSLKVLAHGELTMAEGTPRSPARIAGQLGAHAVVTGSIRRSGDSVRVGVRLLRTADSSVRFAREYLGRLGDLPEVQRQITIELTAALGARLGAERSRLARRNEVDQRAYEANLRGRFYLEHDELERARAQFEQASRIAPDWAPPYIGLANYYSALPFYSDVSPVTVLPKARAALAQALTLDETLAEAHAAQAYIRAYYEWDWRAAEREFRRAIELRPSYGDAYFSYSRFLASRRRLDEAIAQLGRAVELDPLSAGLRVNRALLDYFAGRYDSAGSRLREALAIDSTDVSARWGLALVLEQQGKADSAIALLEPIAGDSPNRRASLGHAYATAGRTAQARSVLSWLEGESRRRYVPSYFLAVACVGLGQKAEALRWLERAYEERSTVLAYVLIDPRLAPLREDPRYQALARQLDGEQ